jgi:uncharacterized OB-fold protein
MKGPPVLPTPISRPYWDGLALDKLVIQRCDACGSWVHYPRIRCSTCLSDQLRWHEVSPTGILYAFSIARHPTAPWFPADPPQVIAVVELANGVRLSTNIVDAAAERLSIGMAVTGVFEHRDDVTLLRFRPAEA